jgi:hypothetical protein
MLGVHTIGCACKSRLVLDGIFSQLHVIRNITLLIQNEGHRKKTFLRKIKLIPHIMLHCCLSSDLCGTYLN